MKSVAVVTDSIACLTRELAERYQIEVIPINFYAGGKLYRDWVDVTPSQAYELFLQDPASFKTSAASPEDCLTAFRHAVKRARDIVCVTLSTRLSSLNNSALEAREMAKAELPGCNIEVIDSLTATPAEGFVALAGARAAEEGKNLSEVVHTVLEVRDKVHAVIFLDTIRHVYRSGRIPKIASQVGSVLNIKPILTVAGAVYFTTAVRNHQHGIERILQMMRDKVNNKPVHVSVFHAYDLEEAQKLMARVAKEFNCAELWLAEFSPVMGYACGTGTIGLAFYTD